MSSFIVFTKTDGKNIAIPRDRITRVEVVNNDPVIYYLADGSGAVNEQGVSDDWDIVVRVLNGS